MKQRFIHRAASLSACVAALSTLAACGGGGDSTPTINSVNVAAFEHNRLRASGQWTLQGTGTVNGTSAKLQLVFTLAPGSAAAFPLTSVTGNTSIQTVTISGSGTSSTSSETVYYDDADHVFGTQDSDGSCASVIASTTALPTSAAIGSSGAFVTAQQFTGCTAPAIPVSTATETWSVENDGGVILVCENTSQLAGGSTLTGSICLESDANGGIGGRARVMVAQDGNSFVARNY